MPKQPTNTALDAVHEQTQQRLRAAAAQAGLQLPAPPTNKPKTLFEALQEQHRLRLQVAGAIARRRPGH